MSKNPEMKKTLISLKKVIMIICTIFIIVFIYEGGSLVYGAKHTLSQNNVIDKELIKKPDIYLVSKTTQDLMASDVNITQTPAYITSDNWKGSGLIGHRSDKVTYWTDKIGANATWIPAFGGPVISQVWFHKMEKCADTQVQIEILHNRKRDKILVDFSQSGTKWLNLGTFDFSGEGEEYVRLTKICNEGKIVRISAVRFDVLGESKNSEIIQSFVLDEVTGGPLVEQEKWIPLQVHFDDLQGNMASSSIEKLALRGIVNAVTQNEFKPDKAIECGEFSLWILRALERINKACNFVLQQPSTAEEREKALREAVKRGLIPKGTKSGTELKYSDIFNILDRDVELSRKNLQWSGSKKINWLLMADNNLPVTRAEAAKVLWQFVQTIVEQGPPTNKNWKLIFQDEFEGDKLDNDKWSVEAGPPGHILSSRWPENVQVNNGLLRLLTKKENRGGKVWTTGNIWTKQFRQQYGYFEARIKVGKATGLNNAFWLMTNKKETKSYHFEIDITEAQYPNRNLITVHDWSGEHKSSGISWTAPENLSDGFHVYGLEWNNQELVWYFDGQEIRCIKHDFCHEKSPVRISSAVGGFAGRITDALDGTVMEVDWVRVYKEADKESF